MRLTFSTWMTSVVFANAIRTPFREWGAVSDELFIAHLSYAWMFDAKLLVSGKRPAPFRNQKSLRVGCKAVAVISTRQANDRPAVPQMRSEERRVGKECRS